MTHSEKNIFRTCLNPIRGALIHDRQCCADGFFLVGFMKTKQVFGLLTHPAP